MASERVSRSAPEVPGFLGRFRVISYNAQSTVRGGRLSTILEELGGPENLLGSQVSGYKQTKKREKVIQMMIDGKSDPFEKLIKMINVI